MEIKGAQAAIESILFANGEPISLQKICDIIEMDKNSVLALLNSMSENYLNDESRGIMLLRLEDKYQLCTKERFSNIVKKALDNRRIVPLSPASLEVLAIIAYNQPVTRAYIEQIRGVECSAVIGNLADKELVEEKGRLDAPGRPLLYGTTPNFLRCFGISSLTDLPDLPELTETSQDA